MSGVLHMVMGAPAAAMPIGLIADDLTGALDAAAPFARQDAPVAVLRRVQNARSSFAIDAGTRGGTEAEAVKAASRGAAALRGAATAFRKIDSLLRGHAAAEIAATAQAGRFATVVVAPAFPAQGRITLQGRQYVRRADGTYHLIAVDLAVGLAEHGLPVRTPTDATPMVGAGVFLCDAEYDTDLANIAADISRLKPPVLWCGSGGLARALAGAPPPVALPWGPWLGVVGSRHASTLGEIAALRASNPDSIVAVTEPGAAAGAVAQARWRLERGAPALIFFNPPALPEAEATRALGELARAVTALAPRMVFASGGDTLAALRDAAGASRLDVVGEAAPGVPVSRMVGGAWNGVTIVSKSGAFAGREVLAQMFGRSKEKSRVRA